MKGCKAERKEDHKEINQQIKMCKQIGKLGKQIGTIIYYLVPGIVLMLLLLWPQLGQVLASISIQCYNEFNNFVSIFAFSTIC